MMGRHRGNGDPSCPHTNTRIDSRMDNNYRPPEQHNRQRCLDCGWQGKWRSLDKMIRESSIGRNAS